MKKLLIIALVASVAAFAVAQEGPSLKLSGEAKTGILYQDSQQDGGEVIVEELKVESHDGDPNGNRFRLNMDYDNGNNVGFRARLQWENWSNDKTTQWAYAFGYGNFFNDTLAQMTVSVGKLGGSPWGTGGDMWKELEDNNSGGGMRIEWKPAFSEQYGRINAGFVLNYYNGDRDQGIDNKQVKITLVEILKESVLGISYTHDDWVMIRLAYRFDSEIDARQDNKIPGAGGQGEDELVYRVEERAIRNYLPGLRLWALGHLAGLSAKNKEIQFFRNWFFVEYDPPELFGVITPFTAQLSAGVDSTMTPTEELMGEFFVKPSFYWHFLNKLVSAGSAYRIAFDYGEGGIEGEHPYYYMEIEPKIQLNFQSSYIAFAYQFRREYKHERDALPGREPIVHKQWMNLRFGIYF